MNGPGVAAVPWAKLAVIGPTGCKYLDEPRQEKYVVNGWNYGDSFMMDADGYFYYQARDDDMIITAGYNVAGPGLKTCLAFARRGGGMCSDRQAGRRARHAGQGIRCAEGPPPPATPCARRCGILSKANLAP